jgi:multiple sugar transport system permease protein
MISPMIFFQVITGVIVALQVLVQPLLLTNASGLTGVGSVPKSNRLYMVEVYQEFFLNSRFGYGSAMLWVFFVIILALTLFLLRSTRSLVHYEVDTDAPEGATR